MGSIFRSPPPVVVSTPFQQASTGSSEIRPYAPVEPFIEQLLPEVRRTFTRAPELFTGSLVPGESSQARLARSQYGQLAAQASNRALPLQQQASREFALARRDPLQDYAVREQRNLLTGVQKTAGQYMPSFSQAFGQEFERGMADPMEDPIYRAQLGTIAQQAREMTERDKQLAQEQAIQAGQFGLGSTALGELGVMQQQKREELAQRQMAEALGSAEQRRAAALGRAGQIAQQQIGLAQAPGAQISQLGSLQAQAEAQRMAQAQQAAALQQQELQTRMISPSLYEAMGQQVEARRAAEATDAARLAQQGQEARRAQLVTMANLFGGLAGLGSSTQMQQTSSGFGSQAFGGGASPFSQLVSAAATGGKLYAMSDKRLKTKIKFVRQMANGIRWYTWEWKDKSNKQPCYGVIAQEVQKIKPNAVKTGPDGYLMVNYGAL